MKRITKVLSGFLSAALAFNLVAPTVSKALAAADDTIESMSEVIKNGFMNYESVIDISKFELPLSAESQDKITEVINYVRKIPEMFCVDVNLEMKLTGYEVAPGKVIITGIKVTYGNTPEDAQAALSELNTKIDQVIEENITDGMTDLQKLLKLHDYIVLNTVYDTKGSLPDRDNGASAYDILVCGNGVCEGYAQAYNMLLDRVGIESIMVTSYDMNHAWNLVNLEGEWYHVDTTWDDPVPDAPGQVNHKYFLLSDETIKTTNELRVKVHEKWDSKGFEALSTRYDDAFWGPVSTEIVTQGDTWYYISEDGVYSSYTESTGESSANVCIDDEKWLVWGKEQTWYLGKYASLIISDGFVIYNTPTMIYKMNLDGSNKESLKYVNPYDTNGYVYGLRLIDGVLYASIKQAPDQEGTLYQVMTLDLDNYSYYDTLLESIADLKDGQTLPVDMKTDTEKILPKEAIECMRNRNVRLTIDLGDYNWDINGKNVTAEEAKDLSLEIKQDQGIIPEEMKASISGSHTSVVELNLTHSGEFGLSADIRYGLGEKYSNSVAELYYYNQANETMDKIDFSMTDGNGNLEINLNHASSYAVVLRSLQMPEDPVIGDDGKPPEDSEITEPEEETAVAEPSEEVKEPEEITNAENTESEETIAPSIDIEETEEEPVIAPSMDVEETEEEILKGDVDMNGRVDVTDLTVLSLACLQETQLTDAQSKAADVTFDSIVNLNDLACLKQFLMNVIKNFG